MTMTTEQAAIAKAIDALERELQSCIDRLHHAVAASLREDLRQRIDAIREAISALRALPTPEQPRVLTDDHYNILKERMIEEHRKYGNALRPGHWAEIAARKVASHLADFGYLSPAKPFPVDEVMEVLADHNANCPSKGYDETWAEYDERERADFRARLTAKLSKP